MSTSSTLGSTIRDTSIFAVCKCTFDISFKRNTVYMKCRFSFVLLFMAFVVNFRILSTFMQRSRRVHKLKSDISAIFNLNLDLLRPLSCRLPQKKKNDSISFLHRSFFSRLLLPLLDAGVWLTTVLFDLIVDTSWDGSLSLDSWVFNARKMCPTWPVHIDSNLMKLIC